MTIGTPTLIASSAQAAQTGTTVVPITTNATAGNKMILWARGQSSKVISSIADTQGNTWTVDTTSVTANQAISFAECQPTTPLTTSDTVTITWSSSTSATGDVQIVQVSGLVTGNAFDKTAQGQPTGTNTLNAGTTATLAQANELVIAFFVWNVANSAFTAGGSFTAFTLLSSSEGAEWEIVAATTAISATATTTGTPSTTHGVCCTFKGSSGNIATVTGLAAASVSTVTGLAYASIGNIDGIAAP